MRMEKKIFGKEAEEKIKERQRGKVDVQLGKNGISDSFIKEVKNRLEKHGVVKIRVLRSFRKTYNDNMAEIAEQVARATNSQIYEIRGFTIILIKEK